MIYGLHKSQSNSWGYQRNENGTLGNPYYNSNRKIGLNGEEEHKTEVYTPSWGGNSTHDAYNREYGTPKPAQRGYNNYNYTTHFYDEDAKKEWWNHLVKDKNHLSGDGMVSITLGIPDYKLDGSRPYSEVVKEAIEEQAARDNRAKTSPEDLAIGREIKESVPSSVQTVGSSTPTPTAPAPAPAAPAASTPEGTPAPASAAQSP